MAYITVSNSKKIIRKLDEKKLEEIAERLYKWDIYFFSKRESAMLKGIRELLRDPQFFATHYYHHVDVVDSYKYIFPESQPAYHKDDTCERLKSNFRNVEIPVAIQSKGAERVQEFRDWYLHASFDKENVRDYIDQVTLKFPEVGEINPKSIDFLNSGTTEKKNYSLNELEYEIDTLLRGAADYFKSNPDIQHIIRRYQKWTFLAYVHGNLYNNESGLTDDELKIFLRTYDENYKKPVKAFLEEYYRIKFNPEMSFEGSILKQLGFRPCGTCLKNNDNLSFSPSIIDTVEDNYDLPY